MLLLQSEDQADLDHFASKCGLPYNGAPPANPRPGPAAAACTAAAAGECISGARKAAAAQGE